MVQMYPPKFLDSLWVTDQYSKWYGSLAIPSIKLLFLNG